MAKRKRRITLLLSAILGMGASGLVFAAGEKEASAVKQEEVTLTYWCELLSGKVAGVFKNLGETELYKEMQKRLGIKVTFLHPPAGQTNEQFNLIVASMDLPDVFERNFGDSGPNGYPGGPEKAVQDGIIIPLNDLIAKNEVPYFKGLLVENPQYDRDCKTDNGNYYSFPFIRGGDSLTIYYGSFLRKDYLDELGLAVPVTVSDWENVLRAFKAKKKLESPLSFEAKKIGNGDILPGAFGVTCGFYQVDGKVKYGPAEPGYKDFLATTASWYGQGLIDPDFASQDSKTWEAKITAGQTGAFLGYVAGDMGYLYDLLKSTNPAFSLVAAPHPVLKAGEKGHFGQKSSAVNAMIASITSACKHPAEAARWLDYGYGPEGHMLFNFGVEGKSYVMKNGYPTYTDWVTKNPDGIPISQTMSSYMRSHYSGPFVQDVRYFDQLLQYPDQRKAIETWAASSAFDRTMPRITPTPDESTRFASIMNEITTYVSEMRLKFIMGQESLDNYASYVQQIKKMGIDEALRIQQAALERYYGR